MRSSRLVGTPARPRGATPTAVDRAHQSPHPAISLLSLLIPQVFIDPLRRRRIVAAVDLRHQRNALARTALIAEIVAIIVAIGEAEAILAPTRRTWAMLPLQEAWLNAEAWQYLVPSPMCCIQSSWPDTSSTSLPDTYLFRVRGSLRGSYDRRDTLKGLI